MLMRRIKGHKQTTLSASELRSLSAAAEVCEDYHRATGEADARTVRDNLRAFRQRMADKKTQGATDQVADE